MNKAKVIARSLQDANRGGRSWREIARVDYGNRISHATLRSFAVSKGKHLPEKYKVLLGLEKAPKPTIRTIEDLARHVEERSLLNALGFMRVSIRRKASPTQPPPTR